MLSTIFHIVITIPLFEYGIHYILHKIDNKTHKEHHVEYHNNENSIEKHLIWILPQLYYFECYLIMIGLTQYLIIHTLIHFYPNYLPKIIVNHHVVHHSKPNCNYAISNPYIDYLFGTNLN